MTERDHSTSSLALPTPSSPAALDDKILAYADAHKPAQSKHSGRRAMGGIASAAVLVVAVLISEQAPLTPQELHQPKPAAPQAEFDADIEMAASAPAPSLGDEVHEENPAAIQLSAPAPAAGQAPLTDDSFLARKSTAKPNQLTLEEQVVSAQKRQESDAAAVIDIQLASSAEEATVVASSGDESSLAAVYKLIEAGEIEKAKSALARWKLSCVDCPIPTELSEQLKIAE